MPSYIASCYNWLFDDSFADNSGNASKLDVKKGGEFQPYLATDNQSVSDPKGKTIALRNQSVFTRKDLQ